MSLTTAPAAYEDCRKAMDEALASERGIRLVFDTENAAFRMRARLNQYRAQDRKKSYALYPTGHPSQGTSVWDSLSFSIDPENKCCVLLQPSSPESLRIEKL